MSLTKKIIYGFICLTLITGLIAGCGGDDDPVNQDNTAPVAVADEYDVHTDSILTVAAPGVLANDTDADDDAITAVKVADPSNGVLTLNANGSFTYNPDADFAGVDIFTYRANDGTENSNTVNVTITVRSPTHITEDIDSNTTWTLLGSPYIVTTDIYIEASGSGATLTIEPGVVVKMRQGTYIYVSYHDDEYGAIIAEGTAANPITFTSDAANPDAGDWNAIRFSDGTLPTTSFDYCIFEYGGGNTYYGMIDIEECAIAIDNSIIRHSGNYGIDLTTDGEFSSFTGNKLYSIDEAPIYVAPNYVHTIGVIDSISTPLGILVQAGTYEQTNETWLAHDAPYIIEGDLYVEADGAGATLIIQAGATVKINDGVYIYVSYHANLSGAIVALGAIDNPITFTSSAAVPENGDWASIRFSDGTLPTTAFNHCIFKYGGSNTYYGMIDIEDCEIAIDNSTICNSGNYGIDLNVEGEFSSFVGNRLYDNDNAPIYINPNYVHTIGEIDSIATDLGIWIADGYYKQTDETWLAHDVPYIIKGDVYIEQEGTSGATLTIEPGTILRFDNSAALYVGYHASKPGALIADGTETDSIIFTSSSPSPGNGAWGGIRFYDETMSTSKLGYCKVLYGGSSYYGNVYCDEVVAGSPTITHCELAYSAGYGIDIYYCTPTYSDNNIHDNSLGDIHIEP